MNNPNARFVDAWLKYLTIPPQPLMLLLDAASWVAGSALTGVLARLVTPWLALPLLALLVGLLIAVTYSPRLRLLACIRFLLLIIGLVIVL